MRNMLFAFAAVLLLSGCSGKDNSAEISACIDRGVAYYKEIGSYPRLSSHPNTGRRAEEVAKERCNRTTTAF